MTANIWSQTERRLLNKLKTPMAIQEYLDSLEYNTEDITRSPRGVMRVKQAHCFDGALFAAAAIEHLGFPPLIVDLRANMRDDDHLIVIFRQRGLWGAVAQSNYPGCRYREPVYRNLRELVMAYFNDYFNLARERTLREYSVPFDMRKVRDFNWRTGKEDLTPIGDRIDATRHFSVLPKRIEKHLTVMDLKQFKAGTLGVKRDGAFKV